MVSRDNTVQAVVVAETFGNEFAGLSDHIPLSLLPVVNKPLIDYTLEFLSLGGVEETFLFCSSHVTQIRQHVSKSVEETVGWSVNMKVHVIVSESCRSVGDCLRDLDARGHLRGDFVLVEPGALSNIALLPLLRKHSELCRKDKGAAMTLIFQETGVGHRSVGGGDAVLVAADASNRVLFHKKIGKSGKKIDFPLEIFLENASVTVRRDVKDANVAVCSAAVLPLFSDNFDFQTKDDFVRCLLMNEEIMGNTVYCHILTGDSYGGAIHDWRTYQSVSMELKNHWIHPLEPSGKRNRFVEDDSTVAPSSHVAGTATLRGSVVGARVTVRDHVTLRDAFVMDDVVLEEDVAVTSSVVGPGCVLDAGVEVYDSVVRSTAAFDAERLGERAYRLRIDDVDVEEVSDDASVTTEEADSVVQSPPPDDTKLFFAEVLDSLTRGYEDKLLCDNLILEVNSSRYAYNVAVKEVNFNVIKAILTLSLALPEGATYLTHYVKLLNYFAPVLRNYVKNAAAMLDCLQAFEEIADFESIPNDKWSIFTLKYLYEKDYVNEDAILKWFGHVDDESRLRRELKPFVEWLREAEEEEEEEETSTEDSD